MNVASFHVAVGSGMIVSTFSIVMRIVATTFKSKIPGKMSMVLVIEA